MIFWHAFTTHPQREVAAQDDLRERGLRALVPMVERVRVKAGKSKIITLPGVRGYVFVQFGQIPGVEDYERRRHAVLKAKFIGRIVHFNGTPGKITDEIFGAFVDRLTLLPAPQPPQFQLRTGTKVAIKKGAFAELNAEVIAIEDAEARILVDLFGRSCETKVAISQLEELDTGGIKISSREKRRLQGGRKSGFAHVG